MEYVDGFVLPVAKKRVKEYQRMAKLASKVWREHGALDYRECIADDVSKGKRTSFPRSVKMKPNETVILAWITYKSRKHRDAVNKKAMKDKRFDQYKEMSKMPFDMKRMFWGGFQTLVT